MKTYSFQTGRIHSLDSLRAIMMLLGPIIHSAVTYGVIQRTDWPLKDPTAIHAFNDYLVLFIHAFRMQIFFMVTGFFGAMLFYERGIMKMIKNRLARIAYPFVVFLLLLWPLLLFGLQFTGMVFAGKEDAFAQALAVFSNSSSFIPAVTLHLWFLYYLIFMTVAVIPIALALSNAPQVTSKITTFFEWIIQKPVLRIFFFATFTAIIYFMIGQPDVVGAVSFKPNILTFFYYFLFYIVGWIFYKSKHLLSQMMRLDWGCTILAVVLFTVAFLMPDYFNHSMEIINQSLVVWLFVFGVTGLFIRYGSHYSAVMRYISDSSYWVYLLHLPIVIIISGLIVDWSLHSVIKSGVAALITVFLCLLSYHYLVRATFIGQFLNGRKYSLKFSDLKSRE